MRADYAQARPNKITEVATTPHIVINSTALTIAGLILLSVFATGVSIVEVRGVLMIVPLKLLVCMLITIDDKVFELYPGKT